MDYDDWLFESIKRYEKLSMFDVRHKVTAADCVDKAGLLLATDTASKNRYELMELHFPDKIINTDLKLHRDRDFRVASGGFLDKKVDGLKHIPGTRKCVVTKSGDNSLELLSMGDDSSDLIKPVPGCVVSFSPNMASPIQLSNCVDNKIVASESIEEVMHVDLEKFAPTRKLKQAGQDTTPSPLTDLFLLDDCSTVVGNMLDGDILQWDLRDPHTQTCHKCCKPSNNKTARWTMAKFQDKLVQVSNQGDVCRLNINDSAYVQRWKLDLPVLMNVSSRLCLQCCPNDDRICISGFAGEVYIYNLSSKETKQLQPVFIHDGHVMNSDQSEGLVVLRHLWYPGQQDVIVSMATDGSLHAWSYRNVTCIHA